MTFLFRMHPQLIHDLRDHHLDDLHHLGAVRHQLLDLNCDMDLMQMVRHLDAVHLFLLVVVHLFLLDAEHLVVQQNLDAEHLDAEHLDEEHP